MKTASHYHLQSETQVFIHISSHVSNESLFLLHHQPNGFTHSNWSLKYFNVAYYTLATTSRSRGNPRITAPLSLNQLQKDVHELPSSGLRKTPPPRLSSTGGSGITQPAPSVANCTA